MFDFLFNLDVRRSRAAWRWRRGVRRVSLFSLLALLPEAALGQSEPSAVETATAPGAAAESPPPAGVMTRAPELLHFERAVLDPSVPPLPKASAVRLALTVQVDGSVSDIEVVSGVDPARDAAARAAAEKFRFRPAQVDGATAAVRLQYDYVYEAPAAAAPAASPPPPPPTPSGRLEGQILESGTRQPLIAAEVRLPEHGLSTLTDGEGRFSFDAVPEGQVTIVVSEAHHESIEDTEQVQEGSLTELRYYTDPTGFGEDDLVVVGRRVKKQVVRREISVAELSTVPGSNGDALKAVQNLPGVARTLGDDIVLRGIGGGQVFLNGHPIASAFHFGGLRSTVANGLIESLEVTPGNYDARFGNGLSGVVDIVTKRPSDDAYHGYGQIDLFDTALFLEGPAGKHGSFALGARRSYIDVILAAALSDEDKETFQVAPRYYDYQGTYDYQHGKHRLRFNAFGSSDSLELLLDEPSEGDPSVRGSISANERWATGQALWDYRASDETRLSLGLAYLWGNSEQRVGADFVTFTAHELSLRADLEHRFAPWLSLRTGLHGRNLIIDYDVYVPPPPAEGQPNQNLSLQESLAARGTAAQHIPAGYVALDMQLGPLLFVPALRIEHYSEVNELAGTLLLQPRVDARLSLTDTTALKAGVGLYGSAPNIVESNETFGNPQIEPQRATHYSAGFEQGLTEALTLDMTGFYQDLYDQISPVDDPAIKYDNAGSGRVYGAEFLLKHDQTQRFYGWLAYTLMRSERKDSGSEDYRLFDLDQTHNLNLVAQYRLTPTWEFGMRFRYVSGNPTTPVVDAIYDSDADVYSPVYGEPNSDRVAAFHQLDLRVDKHWIFDTWRMTTYIDVQNAYNRQNAEGVNYNYNYRQSKTRGGLPLIPSFGIRGEF